MKVFCILFFTFYLGFLHAQAQQAPVYDPFALELGLGDAIRFSGKTGGIVFANPGYTWAVRYRTGIQLSWVGYNENTIASSLLTLDYYFLNTRRFRVSAGGGYGYYTNAIWPQTFTIPELKEVYHSNGKMGGNFRIGVEWNHLSIRMAYHFVPTLYQFSTYNNGPVQTTIYNGNYLGLTIGIRIWGGIK
jgi:hypothetical protein